ncbi:MAG: aromatic acid decarboxylase [Methanomassiliicoccales archaeon PtaU1.Bin124]|nr:MAG: aromatic acid decarboxylase [Methanomassiliicoccales archaeon PtaU1.Bin124]
MVPIYNRFSLPPAYGSPSIARQGSNIIGIVPQDVRHVVAMTGASGIPYGVRLLRSLPGEKILVMSEMAKRILPTETDLTVADVESMADEVYQDDDLFAPIASGSYKHDGMVICPCSESTLGKIASGIADTLITRAASVCLKEGRQLVIVPRETPLSQIMIENELRVSRAGGIIVPASPAFYNKPKTVDDMVDFVVGKVLDRMGVDNHLFQRWA